jgi:hypothetical protein
MSKSPFDREPADRAWRIIGLSDAIEIAADSLDGDMAERGKATMAIRHLTEAIHDEAAILVDETEKLGEPDAEASGHLSRRDVAAVYDTLTLTKGLFEATFSVAQSRVPNLGERQAIDAGLYAIEEKVLAAEAQLRGLMERLKPSRAPEETANDRPAN